MTDYENYKLNPYGRLLYFGGGTLLFFGLGLLFYRNIIWAGLCCLALIPLKKECEKFLAARRRRKLTEAFKEVLYSISASVAAGRQLPTALKDACIQAELNFGQDSDMATELREICRVYESVHTEPEELLAELGKRSGIEEIGQFATACIICRRCGGDLENICLKSANLLIDKLEYRREAESLAAQKRLDVAVLTALPLLILLFLNLISPEYLQPLYSGLEGRLLMSECLVFMVIALLWSLKITDLEL